MSMSETADYKILFEQQLEQNKQLQILIQQLQQQIEQLLRAQFGKKSERQRKAPKDKSIVSAEKADKQDSSPRTLPESLERKKFAYDIAEGKKHCKECELPLTQIKSLTTEQLSYQPGRLFVKKHVRYRYACRRCSQTIVTASMPNQPIERGLADANLLAQVIIDKYQDHLPLYRQEGRWQRQGFSLPRSTLCDWVMSCAALLKPLMDEMKADVLRAKKIHSDDTPVPVLAKNKTHQGRLWVYVGGGGNASPVAVIYDYTETRSSKGPVNFLQSYRGFLQADAYAGYDVLYQDNHIIEVGCMAHARRKFFDAFECGDKHSTHSLSQHAIDFIGKLYHLERCAKSMTPLQRYYYRRRYAKPILQRFKRWLNITQHQAFPKSLLGKAITYTLNHWRALTHYCRDGVLDIDNNVAERAIKPLVIGRKNYLFAGSHDGARAAAVLYSLIETCKLFNVNTYDYLSDVLARLPNTLNKDIRQLLPYCWKPSKNN
jgi:transposase